MRKLIVALFCCTMLISYLQLDFGAKATESAEADFIEETTITQSEETVTETEGVQTTTESSKLTTYVEENTIQEEETTTEVKEPVKPVPTIKSVKLSATKLSYNGKNQFPKVTVKNSEGKKLTEGKSYTVKFPEKSKAVGTYKVTVKFKGNYSGKKTLTYQIVPKNISNLKYKQAQKKIKTTHISWATDDIFSFEEYWEKGYSYTMVETNGIVLNWDKVKGATGYRLYIYNNGDWTKVKNLTKNTYTNTDVTAGKAYKYAVKAYQKVGDKYYYSKDFTVVTAASRPEKTSFKLEIKNNKAYLTWNKRLCTGYILIFKYNDGTNDKVYVKDRNTTKYVHEFPKHISLLKIYVKTYTQTDSKKLASKATGTYIQVTPTQTSGGIPVKSITSDTAKKIVKKWERGTLDDYFEGKSSDGKKVIVYERNPAGWTGIDMSGAYYSSSGEKKICEYCGKILGKGTKMCRGNCAVSFGYSGESS